MNKLVFGLVDVVEFLESLGIQNVREVGDEVEYSCPFPGHSHADTKPSATMSKVEIRRGNELLPPTTFNCFGCHSSGNAVTFLTRLEGVSPWKARQWIRERWGGGFREPDGSLVEELMRIVDGRGSPSFPRMAAHPIDERYLDGRLVDWSLVAKSGAETPLGYMLERGFSAETLEEWEIGWDPISERICIPVRNVHGELMGFKGRACLPDQQPKYRVLGDTVGKTPRYGFEPYEVSRVLFGLYRAAGERVIVCEGELNAIALWEAGIPAVAVAGSRLTTDQAVLLRDRCKHAVFWFDSGDAGEIGLEDACEKLVPFMRVSFVPPSDMDAAELPVQGRIDAIAGARSAISSLVG